MSEIENAFTFYRTYYDSISRIQDEHTQKEVYRMICEYALNGTSPASDSDIAQSIFEAHRFNIDNSLKRRRASVSNGKKGGAPSESMIGNQNARKTNLIQTQNKPKSNLKEKDKDKVKDKVKVKTNREDKEEVYRGLPSALRNSLDDYEVMRERIRCPLTNRARKTIINKLQEYSHGDVNLMVDILNQSIVNSWRDVFPLREIGRTNNRTVSVMDIMNL